MSLKDYLKGGLITLSGDPDNIISFNPELYSRGSKGLDYPGDKHGLSQSPLLGNRVTFSADSDANPTFEYGDNYGRTTIDQFIRGGAKYAREAREIDFDRISKFLYETPNGELFLAKQTTLQSQNPRPQKIYNLGVNTLASVAAAGVSNVRRGGLLPEVGGFDIGSILGLEAGTYLSEPDFQEGALLREEKYGLGSPGAPSEKKGLAKFIDIKNPFKSDKVSYNVSLGQEDKVNSLMVYQYTDQLPGNKFEEQNKDFVPFRFEVLNPAGKGFNNVIAFRAFLDSIGDDYSATHNTYKYNGRGEEFHTYNKFNRKISISFKAAAQSRSEMQPIYHKLNYLASQTAPGYSGMGRIRTPYLRLTVGNWFNDLPGLITSVNLKWQKDYPWEIALDRSIDEDTGEMGGKDADMLILPHILDVSLGFQPIHDFVPRNSVWAPFIGLDGDENSTSFMRPSQMSITKIDPIEIQQIPTETPTMKPTVATPITE